MINSTETLREAIKSAMEGQGHTVYSVTKKAKISRPAFGRFLVGGDKGLNTETMFKVLVALGITGLEPVGAKNPRTA